MVERSAHGTDKVTRDELEQRKLVQEITSLFEHKISFNEFLGIRLERLEIAPVRIGFDMRPEFVGHYVYGRLHGGMISSVLDVVGGLAVMWAIAEYYQHEDATTVMKRFTHLGTIDLRVDYLRQGIGKEFFAEATVVRLGKRIAACQMSLLNEESTLIATGNANYIVS